MNIFVAKMNELRKYKDEEFDIKDEKIMIIVMKINTILIVKYQETTSFDILVDIPINFMWIFSQ